MTRCSDRAREPVRRTEAEAVHRESLIRNPKILILDDCTSALERRRRRSLTESEEMPERMTVLLVSQRISTVMRADRILCLEDGTLKGTETMRNC